MRRLICNGFLIAVLAVMLVAVPMYATYPSGYTSVYFSRSYGDLVSVSGFVMAYEPPYQDYNGVKLLLAPIDIISPAVVTVTIVAVAGMWSPYSPQELLYRTSWQELNEDTDEAEYYVSVKGDDDFYLNPGYGMTYLELYGLGNWYFLKYGIQFEGTTSPQIDPLPFRQLDPTHMLADFQEFYW